MEFSVVYSRAMAGIDAPLVRVESHLSGGLPAFHIVGLPETAVRESKDRVRSALLNSHFNFPDRRITVNLSPADLPKEGGRFDLPIALGILAASAQVPSEQFAQHEFLGELALIDHTPRSASVRAETETRALTLRGETFLRLMERRPALPFNTCRVLVRRIKALERRLFSNKGTQPPRR